MPRADGPFEVLDRVNDNAYKVNLPRDYGVSATFNVPNLSPYLEDDHIVNLRENSFQQGEDDGCLPLVSHSGPQNNSETPSSSTNPQALIQAILKQSSSLSGYDPSPRPDSVHMIV